MKEHKRFIWYGYAGIGLVAAFWWINWFGEGLRTHWAFFPLWLGYILFADAVAVYRGQQSLSAGRPYLFTALFLVSIPSWWLFEWLNHRAQYWEYLPANAFGPIEHTLWSTLCFSTVVPAIFTTANALLSISWFKKHHIHWRTGHTAFGRWLYFFLGFVLLIVLLMWPQYGMAFMWMSLFFIVSPINYLLDRPSILRFTAQRDWRIAIVFAIAALICGFFWELWNMYAWPKWIYTFPYLDQFKVFEMPLAGYLGYLPFGLEVWALTALLFPSANRQLGASLMKEEGKSA